MVCAYKSIYKPSHLWGVNFKELIQRTPNMKNAHVRESARITYDIGLLPSHNRKQHFGLYFILCHREWVFVAGGSLRWLWSMVEPVGAPVERFRCWRPSVVGPHLFLCGAVRPVVVEQWRVQSAGWVRSVGHRWRKRRRIIHKSHRPSLLICLVSSYS